MDKDVYANMPEILIFVEDPGAANYVADLPEQLTGQGLSTRLLSAASATDYLAQRGIQSESLSSAPSLFPFSFSLAPLLIVGTSENLDTFGLELIDRCREAGGVSVGVVDAFANAAYRFRGRTTNPLAHAPDWLLVPDVWTRDAFIALNFLTDHIVICGHPHYDAVRTEEKRMEGIGRIALRQKWLPDAEANRPIVVFVAEISDGMERAQFQRSPDYTLHGRGGNDGRTEIVIEELLDATAQMQPRPYLVLRLHPKNTPKEFARYANCFDLISGGGSPLELVYSADAVVGMTSMLLLEAALLQRPTLAVLPRAVERDWLPTLRSSLTPCATTRAELHALSAANPPANRPCAYRYKYCASARFYRARHGFYRSIACFSFLSRNFPTGTGLSQTEADFPFYA